MQPLQTNPTNTVKNLYDRLRALGQPFWLLWVGETTSMFGTQLVQFALGVWIYERTNSVLNFAGSVVASILPAILVMPVAASVVDRVDKRYVMIIADAIAAVMTFMLLVLLWTDRLEVFHLYAFTAVASVVGAFQGPAYQASVAQIVRKDLLTRATGAMGVSSTSLGIIAPALAGTLLVTIGLRGMVVLDLVTFIVGTMFVWRAFSLARRPAIKEGGVWNAVRSSLSNFTESMAFFERDPKMLTLLVYSLIQAAMIALAVTMVVPLILSLHSSASLGVVLSFGAAGALAGSLLMVVLDEPGRRMAVILCCDAVFAACILAAGMVTSVPAFCVLEFIAGAAGSVAASCSYALWMSKVPEHQQGSILVLLGTCAMLSTTAMVVFGGVAVDLVLEPALAVGGSLAGSIGAVLGTGKGRGMALMFVISGALGLIAALGGLAVRPLRELR